MRCLYLKGCFRRCPRWSTLFLLGIIVNVLLFWYLVEPHMPMETAEDTNMAENIRLVKYNTLAEKHGIIETLEKDTPGENSDRNVPGTVDVNYVAQQLEREFIHTEVIAKIAITTDGVAPQNLENEAKHTEAMDKIAKYPHLRPYVQRLFRLMDKLSNRRKYDNVMAMFDQLVLDLWDAYSDSDTPVVRPGHWMNDDESKHSMDCETINKLEIHEQLGAGYIKSVHLGTYMGAEVAVKIKNMNATELKVCGRTDFPCAVYRDARILGEALLIETLQHPMLIQMIGYCVHSGMTGSSVLGKPGVVLVYPLGIVVRRIPLTQLPWKEKIFHSVQLSTLMGYVEHTPFGRLTLYDFERHQFVWIDGRMYLSDMDVTVNNDDKKCADLSEFPQHSLVTTEENVTNCHFTYPYQLGYEIDIPCVNGVCLHTAQIHNMRAVYRAFFSSLFTRVDSVFPKSLHADIHAMMRALQTFTITADDLHDRLQIIQEKADAVHD